MNAERAQAFGVGREHQAREARDLRAGHPRVGRAKREGRGRSRSRRRTVRVDSTFIIRWTAPAYELSLADPILEKARAGRLLSFRNSKPPRKNAESSTRGACYRVDLPRTGAHPMDWSTRSLRAICEVFCAACLGRRTPSALLGAWQEGRDRRTSLFAEESVPPEELVSISSLTRRDVKTGDRPLTATSVLSSAHPADPPMDAASACNASQPKLERHARDGQGHGRWHRAGLPGCELGTALNRRRTRPSRRRAP